MKEDSRALATLRVLAVLGILAMAVALGYATRFGRLWDEVELLLDTPWAWPPLVDLTVGLVLFDAWLLYREGATGRAFLWALLVLLFGFAVACVYLLVAARTSGGDPERFLMGERRALRSPD